MTGLVSKFINSDDNTQILQQMIIQLEKENQKLKEKNIENINKIQSLECKSILELNRKIRSGIPVKFFPSHSIYGYHNTSQIKNIEYDLH
jgi:hypothetical protein